jgi:hypothetical protein
MTEGKFEFIYKEAYGYQLKCTVVEWDDTTELWTVADISSFTTKKYRIEKPDGTIVDEDVIFETDGTDGVLILVITSAMALLNVVGYYRVQALLSNAAQYFPTAIVGFKVDDPI